MQLSPPSRHSIPLWSKYSPQHPVLKHPQFMFHQNYTTKYSRRQYSSMYDSNMQVDSRNSGYYLDAELRGCQRTSGILEIIEFYAK
jgi:hypothetical protein